MGGRSKETQTGSTVTSLPGNQQGNVDLLMQGARDFYLSGGPKFYGGQLYADPTSQQIAGRENAAGYALGAGQNFVNNYQQGENFWLNPQNIYNPANIPGFQQAQDSVVQTTTRNLMENILPNLNAGSVMNRNLGGSRPGISTGLAVGRTNDALASTLANMQMGIYDRGMNMYNAAAARAPSTYGLGLMPADTLSRVGGEYQNDQQKRIDEAVQRFNFEQLAPLLNLQALQGLTGTAGQYGGRVDSTQTKEVSGGNPFGQILGTALMLGSLMVPGGQELAAGMAGAGGGMGGLFGGGTN